jgi:hypothetical protein
MTTPRRPYHSANNVFHHYKLSRHWEVKCWGLHLEIHPKNRIAKRRVWKVNPNREEEFLAYPFQGEEVVEGEIETHEVHITIEEENRWMPTSKDSPFHFLPTIFQNKFSFLKIY